MKILAAIALALIGCAGAEPAQDAPTCQNITQEFYFGVSYLRDVRDEETNTKMTNGCTLKTITHYVLDSNGSGGGGGGSGPPDPRHCDVDACGGPNDKRITYSDPAPDDTISVLNTSIAN